jgi:hypothetical protein
MDWRPVNHKNLWVIFLTFLFFGPANIANAFESPNFKLEESTIGSGDIIQASSQNYTARGALGDIVVGRAGPDGGNGKQIKAGSQTSKDPTLKFKFLNANVKFTPTFSPSAASTSTAQFSVVNYTSYGYVIQLAGRPPANGNYEITPISGTGPNSTKPSQPGIEQFGVNMVANSLPVSFGSNPNVGDFGEGVAETNYNIANEFRYVNGETIASAPKSSGETIYTLSYMVNVSSLTPGGKYTSNQTIIVTGTY